jgi:hypothetical protein
VILLDGTVLKVSPGDLSEVGIDGLEYVKVKAKVDWDEARRLLRALRPSRARPAVTRPREQAGPSDEASSVTLYDSSWGFASMVDAQRRMCRKQPIRVGVSGSLGFAWNVGDARRSVSWSS